MRLKSLRVRGSRRIWITVGAVAAVLVSTGVAVAATSSNASSQFTVVKGSIRKATGTPPPASGTEAVLWSGASVATTTISGSGRILIGAIGDECDGWPTIRVFVGDRRIGDTTIVNHTKYGTYGIGPEGESELPEGKHTVQVHFVNDKYAKGRCDRNVALGYARMEYPSGDSNPTGGPATGAAPASSRPPTSATPTATGTASGGFVHPGIGVSKSQLDLIKAKVAAGQEPWKSAYNRLMSQSGFGQKASSLSYVPKPVAVLKCATAGGRDFINAHPERTELKEQGCEEQTQDAIAALTHALLWYINGDARHAQKSIEIMNAWSGTLREIWFDQPRKDDGGFIYGNGKLQAAWTGETITRAAEIIRHTYTPAAGQETFNVARFSKMLKEVLLPLTIDNWTGGAANWLMSTTDATIAIGVFTDDREVFLNGIGDWRNHVPASFYLSTDKPSQPQLAGSPIPPPGTNYDKASITPESMKKYWYSAEKYVDGLTQETCRDLGHTVMGLEATAYAAETARIQGIDLWGEQKNRLVAALELNASYVTAAAAGNTQPSNWACPKPIDLGGAAYKLGWEAAYNHYVNRLGMSLPQTKKVLAAGRPTGAALHMTYATLLFGAPL